MSKVRCHTCNGKIPKYNWNKSSGEYDGTGYCTTCCKTRVLREK